MSNLLTGAAGAIGRQFVKANKKLGPSPIGKSWKTGLGIAGGIGAIGAISGINSVQYDEHGQVSTNTTRDNHGNLARASAAAIGFGLAGTYIPTKALMTRSKESSKYGHIMPSEGVDDVAEFEKKRASILKAQPGPKDAASKDMALNRRGNWKGRLMIGAALLGVGAAASSTLGQEIGATVLANKAMGNNNKRARAQGARMSLQLSGMNPYSMGARDTFEAGLNNSGLRGSVIPQNKGLARGRGIQPGIFGDDGNLVFALNELRRS